MRVTIRCPYCNEEIPSSSSMCPYCGELLDQRAETVRDTDAQMAPSDALHNLSNSEPNINKTETESSGSGNAAASPEANGERPKGDRGMMIALAVAILVAIGVSAVLIISYSEPKGSAQSDNISALSSSGRSDYSSEPKSSGSRAKASEPSSTPVSSAATFYCSNAKSEVTFDYGYVPYTDGDYVILSGDSGALGRYSGYNVLSYKKSSGTYNYVCFGAQVIVFAPMVISICRNIVKEGDCEADTEWEDAYEYYSGTVNRELRPTVYHGSISAYKITMELAFDPEVSKVIGTYYYNRNGSGNRMIVYGDVSNDGTLVLKAYDTKFYDKPSETLVLTARGDGFAGYWERPNRNRLDVNLSR